MGIDEKLIEEIVRRILSIAEPDRIILFGSAAGGEMTRDSDIDLLVLEESPGHTRKESVKIRRAIGSIGYPIDVFVMATERFDESKAIIGGLAYPANKDGKIIYEIA